MNIITDKKKSLTFLIMAGLLLTALIGLNKILSQDNKVSLTEPSNIKVNVLDNTHTEITWDTKTATAGTIVYSQYQDLCTDTTSPAYCLTANEASTTTNHKVLLTNLLPNKTYYYSIKTDEGLYKKDLSFSSFKTNNELSFGISDNNNNLSYNGISGSSKPTLKQKIQNVTSAVLGISTTKPESETIEVKYAEFEKAIKDHDKNYDFNKDGVVDTTDYPLYIEFITNQED